MNLGDALGFEQDHAEALRAALALAPLQSDPGSQNIESVSRQCLLVWAKHPASVPVAPIQGPTAALLPSQA